jgi:hypothetical protein
MCLSHSQGLSVTLVAGVLALGAGCALKDVNTTGSRVDGGVRPDGAVDVGPGDAVSPQIDLQPPVDAQQAAAAPDAPLIQGGKTPGEPCTVGPDCRSGFCVDGVCCESLCNGTCEACDRADRRGACGPISGPPRPGREACLGTGACAGTCDGTDGARCRYPGDDVECAPATCSAGVAMTRRVCSGAGVCLPAAGVSCAPYACDGPICAGGCGPGRPCVSGTYCTGGRCQPVQAQGSTCTEAGQCASGNCAQGRCCISACTGACQSCALAGTAGTCTTVPFTSDPNNCGRCGGKCSSNHVTPACTGGKCSGACAAGFGDCNNDKASDGCETSLSSASNCRGCGVKCVGTNCLASGCEKIAFQWSYVGPVAGLHCVPIAEAADPHFWGDNFLCMQRDFGFVWSSAGPVPNNTCVQFLEPSDPHTWNDNFLCSPQDYGLRWSFVGPIAGMNCTKIEEPAEPPEEAWTDNYLCAPP